MQGHQGDRVTVLASPVGEGIDGGPVLLRSTNGGATLEGERVGGPISPSFYALIGPDGLAWVDQGRALRLRPSPR